MKIEHLIVQYLYLNKQVTLQGIGTFILDPSVILPAGNEKDKDFVMPENAFQFEYNLKAGEDEGLVKYIVQHTRKILPLASSDLESYAILAKQFLNIGKPLVIEGVGTIQKSQQGNYQFIPGVFITPKIDDFPKQAREKRDESVSFESERKKDNSRRNLMVFITVLVIILVGLGIYYILMNKKPIETEPSLEETVIADTTRMDRSVKKIIDSSLIDTSHKIATPVPKADFDSFKIVLRDYNSLSKAEKAIKRFRSYGHKLELLNEDSLSFQIAMPFKRPLSDTLKTKDSLMKIFGGFPYLKF